MGHRLLHPGIILFIAFVAGSAQLLWAEEPVSQAQTVRKNTPQFVAAPAANQLPQIPTGEADAAGQSQVWSLPADQHSKMLDVLELKNMDINDVFKLLSARTGINIIAGKSVQGRVTMFLKDVDAKTALAVILRANGLAYEDRGGVLEILTDQEYEEKHGFKFGAETKTEIFSLSYAKAEEIIKTLAPMISKNNGYIEFDIKSNKIVVTDSPARIEAIARVIRSLDRDEKQVLIEARIIQVTLNDSTKMGIDWEGILTHDGRSKAQFQNNFTLGSAVSPRSITTIGTLNTNDYKLVLDMLATKGKTKALSTPRIAVVNNQEAKILVGSSEPYVTTSQTTAASGPTTTAETVNFIDVGVKLNVTPMIHEDGYITMKIRPEVSSALKKLTTAQNNEIPIVETSQVETTVKVKDGITIMIGGLIKDETTHSNDKIPFLGDIPLLGHAFRKESRAVNKSEIIVFLTPHIITGDVNVNPEKSLTIKPDKTY